MVIDPVIKWTGSKRSQASQIVASFPNIIDTYYEPFCGSCAILYEVIRHRIKVGTYIVSDINADLIALWKLIQTDYQSVYSTYAEHHALFLKKGAEYYYEIRDIYNNTHDAHAFFFLIRTAINGLIRYNKQGKFNAPVHINRKGINPKALIALLRSWSEALQPVEFRVCNYNTYTKANPDDFFYCDPPYASENSLYFGEFNFEDFWTWLSQLSCDYAFSFNGIAKKTNKVSITVPDIVYTEKMILRAGISSWKKIIQSAHNQEYYVYETLYRKARKTSGTRHRQHTIDDMFKK